MKKVILTMVLLFLVGCDKNVEMTEPVATAGKVGYYGMLELLGMRASDVKEKDENGKDVFIVYGDNKYEIVMYNDLVITPIADNCSKPQKSAIGGAMHGN